MNEIEAARFVRAALDVIAKNIPDTEARRWIGEWSATLDNTIARRATHDAPPWEDHASWPERPATWGTVVPGDYVLAPNGEWYMVDSWSRIGDRVGVLIKVGTETARDSFDARTPVTIRRGPEGQAVDVLAAAGITGEVV